MQRGVSDVDWRELKDLLLEISKTHDENTAFTPENSGLHNIVSLMVECYEYGRTHTLPPYWSNAFDIMLERRDPTFKMYQQHKEMIKKLDKQYEHLEVLDMTELTGGPMNHFLQKETKKKNKKHKNV